MTNLITVIGIIAFLGGGMFKNKLALFVGLALIVFGTFYP